MIGDLHCHTRISDGSLGIEEVISAAKRGGLDFLSITDHDTMSGITRAKVLGLRYGINIIPGIEISVFDKSRNNKAHILCYLPEKPDRLEGICQEILKNREIAGKEMIKKVTRLFPISSEQILKYANGSSSIYKVHIIHALMDFGYTDKINGELYDKLFNSKTGSCYSKVNYPDLYTTLELIKSAGGISVLAHPFLYDGFDLLCELCDKKMLDGVEVWHPSCNDKNNADLLAVADKYSLIKIGGSDFHGMYGRNVNPIATCVSTEEQINKLFAFKHKK